MRKNLLSLTSLRSSFSFFAVVLLFIGLIVAYVLAQRAQDTRRGATSSTAPGRVVFTDAGETLSVVGAPQTKLIQITNLSGKVIDGIQLIITVTGDIPADFAFTANTISGLNRVANRFESQPDGSKRVTLGYITPLIDNAIIPFTMPVSPLTVGQFTYSYTGTGSMTVTVEAATSKILENTTATELLGPVSPFVIDLGGGTGTAAPSASPYGTDTANVSGLTVQSATPYKWVLFQNSAQIFVDRAFQYTNIPVSLASSDALQTANDDKQTATSLELIKFTAKRDITVYVAYTTTNTTLASTWLTSANGWQTLTMTVPTNIVDTPNFLVKSKSFTTGQTVTLYGNGGTSNQSTMYSVIVNGEAVPTVTPTATPTPTPTPTPTAQPTPTPTAGPISGEKTVECASVEFAPNTCLLDVVATSVTLSQQISNSACTLGQTWSFTPTSISVNSGCDGLFLVTYGNVATPTPTAGPAPLGMIDLRFAGVNANVGTITTRVSLGEIGSSTPLFTGTVPATYATGSTYRIDLNGKSIPQPVSGKRYWLAIKGPKHVQRVFGDINYGAPILLTAANQIMQPGDVPPQNGVVDANDINTILAFYTQATHSTSDLAVGDLNFDGVINAVDMGLLLSTLSTKSDEFAL